MCFLWAQATAQNTYGVHTYSYKFQGALFWVFRVSCFSHTRTSGWFWDRQRRKGTFLFKSLCCLPFFFFFPSFTVVLGRCPSVQSRTAGPFLLGGSQMLIKLCRKYPYLSQTGAMSWSNIAFDLKYSASFWLRFIFITAKLFRQHEVCDTCVEICTISTCMLGMIRWISNPSPLLIYCTAQLNVCITYCTDKEGPWKERE